MHTESHPHHVGAQIVLDSCNKEDRLTTMLLRIPDVIHTEMLRHRAFSFSVASNRAIPTHKLLEQVRDNPYVPFVWGKNQPGMVASESVLDEAAERVARGLWLGLSKMAVSTVEALAFLGLHKQHTNRLVQPWRVTHMLVTGSRGGWANFLALRDHPAAMPEIQELARCCKTALALSTPEARLVHLPYLGEEELRQAEHLGHTIGAAVGLEKMGRLCARLKPLGLETTALRGHNPQTLSWRLALLSAARCARLSYDKIDGGSPDLAVDANRGIELMESAHWSPLEHQAFLRVPSSGTLGGSNLHPSWVQFRKLFQNEDIFQP